MFISYVMTGSKGNGIVELEPFFEQESDHVPRCGEGIIYQDEVVGMVVAVTTAIDNNFIEIAVQPIEAKASQEKQKAKIVRLTGKKD